MAVGLLSLGGCKPANLIAVALGNDTLCAQHASGRWQCYSEFGLDMPRDDYVAMSADFGVACGIRPEDGGVECFGENAPAPPPPPSRLLR